MLGKIWNIKSYDKTSKSKLIEELNLNPVIAHLLVTRGINSTQDAKTFLSSRLEDLSSPLLLKDINKAKKRIEYAIKFKEKILIYGDYDVDGVTATALLVNMFSKFGIEVYTYIPDRIEEGYGLSEKSIDFVKEKKVSLVITVDCGVSNFEEVDVLNKIGVDVIITDHHRPSSSNLPNALAIINPYREDCEYPFKALAGVGLAFKLAQVITGEFLKEHLDLVCLGTVSDVVPLIGENRIFAKRGLGFLMDTKKVGIRSLINVSGLANRKMSESYIGYVLGPRINSSGRLGSADTSLKLLLSNSEEEAQDLSSKLNSENSSRQKIGEEILNEAILKVEKEVNFKHHKVIVLDSENWHPGVIGIVASKIAERFFRPTLIISTNQDICKGSGRSIADFHLFEAILRCKDLLESYGGHKYAVGFSIAQENIDNFRDMLNQTASMYINVDELKPKLDIDMELEFDQLNPSTIDEIEDLAPYGEGNPSPLFLTRNLFLKTDVKRFGKDNVKVWLSDGNYTYEAVGFRLAKDMPSLVKNDRVDLVYSPTLNTFKGQSNLQLIIRDLKY